MNLWTHTKWKLFQQYIVYTGHHIGIVFSAQDLPIHMLSDEISTSVDSCTREDHRRASYAKTRHEFNNRLSTVGMGRSPGTQKMYLISSHITTNDLFFPSIGPFYFRSWSSSRQISDSWPTIRKAWFLGTKLQFAEVDLRSSIFNSRSSSVAPWWTATLGSDLHKIRAETPPMSAITKT